MFGPPSSEARTESPTDARVLAARAQGHGPRAELSGLLGASIVALIGFGVGFQPLAGLLQSLLRAALVPSPEHIAMPGPSAALVRLGGAMVAGLLGCLLAMAVARALAQGLTFHVRRATPRTRFAPMPSTVSVRAPLALSLGIALFASLLPEALTAGPRTLTSLGAAFALRAAGGLVGLALVDAFLARAAFFRSLWMTRTDLRREQREAQGNPEARAGRERARLSTGPSRAGQP